MKRYDLHTHSVYSSCSTNKLEDMLKAAKRVGLSGMALTDHNTIKGALKLKKLNKDKGFEVIIGEEIKTNHGEIVALYLKDEIKPGDLFEVMDNVKSQDAIMFIAHPFRLAPWAKFSYPLKGLKGKVHALETFNSRNLLGGNKRAADAAQEFDYACIGTSDAHLLSDFGKGYTLFDDSLRDAIRKKKTYAKGTTLNAFNSIFISTLNKRVFAPLRVKKEWT